MNDWFYVQDGKQLGPISDTELEEKLSSGALSNDTKIWKEGMGDWISAGQKNDESSKVETVVPEKSEIREPLRGLGSLKTWSIIACVVCLFNPFAAFAFVYSLQAQNAHNDKRDEDAQKKLQLGKRMLTIAFILSAIIYVAVLAISMGWIPVMF